MGVYDTLPKGSQVKLWDCEMKTLKVGDSVPDFGLPEYVVLIREGGYVRVKDNVITEISEHEALQLYPEDFPFIPCLDKWGKRVERYEDLIGQFQGLMGMEDPYYFKNEVLDSCCS